MKKSIVAILFFLLTLNQCTGELVISDLINNSIIVKMMGTYESNSPYAWQPLYKDDSILPTTPFAIGAGTNMGALASSLTSYSQVKLYMDIAEIRIAQGQGKSSGTSIDSYWNLFATTRQLMAPDYGALSGKILSESQNTDAATRLSDFFNEGFNYPAVDIANGHYNHIGIYFRRMVSYPSQLFNGDGSYYGGSADSANRSGQFENRTVSGIDIETLLQNQWGEAAIEPRLFPLQRKDLSLLVNNDTEPYTMEIRIFLKNLLMVHLYQVTTNGALATDAGNSNLIYVAPSDWNINHDYSDPTNGKKQGGSVIFTARIYKPSQVGSIQFSNTYAYPSYYAVVPSGTAFSTLTLPYAATAGTSNLVTNLPPGTYDVYRTCDTKKCSVASALGTCDNAVGTDGFPETAKLCGSVGVSTGTTSPLNTAACTCP